MYENEQFLFESLKAGASGYVLKSGADDDIVEASRAAMRGESFLYPSAIVPAISAPASSSPTPNRVKPSLSDLKERLDRLQRMTGPLLCVRSRPQVRPPSSLSVLPLQRMD
jgi:DNA-binding NarL/FixJ family response regulator